MAPMTTRQVTHFVAVCCSCRRDAVVCPKRETADVRARAERAFERAGWHQDGAASNPARSRWYCPACARSTH
jgi:hypothetical protein